MTELMYDDIVGHLERKKQEPPVEGEIPLFRTAPPPSLLVPNGNTAVLEPVKPIPVTNTLSNEGERTFVVPLVVIRAAAGKKR